MVNMHHNWSFPFKAQMKWEHIKREYHSISMLFLWSKTVPFSGEFSEDKGTISRVVQSKAHLGVKNNNSLVSCSKERVVHVHK